VTRVDNRLGYGALKIGMTIEEARAAGLTDLTWDSEGDSFCVRDSKITVSKKFGVVRITLPAGASTSKGIGVGASFGDVTRAYPDASEYRSGWSAKVGDNALYDFVGEPGDLANKVQRIRLVAHGVDCSTAIL
jgi:hypothetical protein